VICSKFSNISRYISPNPLEIYYEGDETEKIISASLSVQLIDSSGEIFVDFDPEKDVTLNYSNSLCLTRFQASVKVLILQL
jgi:hypothetical protein